LYEVVKLRLELDRPCLPIAQELGFDGKPGVPCSGALGGDDFGEVIGEGVENPGLDDAVHPIPVRREGRGGEDVCLEGEFAEDQQKLIAPSVEVVGVDVEDDVDEAPDVVDGNGLGVKVEEGGGLLEQQGRVKVSRTSCRLSRPTCRRIHRSGGVYGGGGCGGARPFPFRVGDGGVTSFGGVGGLLFGLGQVSEGRLVDRLPVRGSSAARVRDQADGELLRLAVGWRCSSSGSRIQGGGLGVSGAGGPVMAQPGQEAGAHGRRGREERGRCVRRCSAGRRESWRAGRCSAGSRGAGA
jgi:hypothetical protein